MPDGDGVSGGGAGVCLCGGVRQRKVRRIPAWFGRGLGSKHESGVGPRQQFRCKNLVCNCDCDCRWVIYTLVSYRIVSRVIAM